MTAGRPCGETDNRNKLIEAARHLFIEKEYSQVTLRDIAKRAGTDPGLIRYYFGAKDKLFISMIAETAQPVMEQLNQIQSAPDATSPARLLATYYQVMADNPHFPKLMYRVMSMQDGDSQFPDISHVFNFAHQQSKMVFFDKLKQQGLLQDDVDDSCAQLSFMSLMIFPFLIPQPMMNKLGIELTPDFISTLAQHNIDLLQRGLMKKEVVNEH